MKSKEIEVGEDVERSSKNVESLLQQVTSNTKDLDHLHERVEERLNKHVDVREELIKQKDQQIKGK